MVKAREELQIASDRYYRSPTENNREEVDRHKSKLHEQYNTTIEKDLDKLDDQASWDSWCDEESIRQKESWRLINDITGRRTAKKGIIKAKDKRDRINKWYTHLKELYFWEKNRKRWRRAGCNITCLTSYRDRRRSIHWSRIHGGKEVYQGRESMWTCIQNIGPETILYPLPKAGDLGRKENYRGISLSCIAAILVNKMILNRISSKIDKHLRPNQNGFRPGRSTTAHIHIGMHWDD